MEQPDALILTGIGIGASFSVLAMLLVAALIIKLAARLINKNDQDTELQEEDEAAEDTEARNRAMAAAIAVTALIESRPYLRERSSKAQSD